MVISRRRVHFANAKLSMFVRDAGMCTLSSEEQSENELRPMRVAPSAITTLVIDWYDDGNTEDNPESKTHCGTTTDVMAIQP